MDRRLIRAQALKRVRVGQHHTALLGQRGALGGDGLLRSHADVKHLTGFFPGWNATEGGQAKRHATRILDLAHPVLLGQAEKRFDWIGANRQADVIEAERRGSLELIVEIAGKLAAHRHGRDRVDERRALGQCVVREALGFELFLAGQKSDGIVPKLLDQRFARG